MAERRMFAKSVVDSDIFNTLPMSARLLYFALGMDADDDGFVNRTMTILRVTGTTLDDLNALINRKYLIAFEDGVVVIRHWKVNNYIQKDRYNPTKCTDDKEMLTLDKDNLYVLAINPAPKIEFVQAEEIGAKEGEKDECIHDVSILDTQVRLGKVRLGKDRDISPSNDGATDTSKTASSSSTSLSKTQQSRFDAFWGAYPKKVGKQDAQKAWKKIAPDEELTDTIIRAVETAKQKDSRFREERFIPHPATWLNAGSWENEYDDYFPAQEQPKQQSGDSLRQLDMDRLLAAATGRRRT